MLTQILLTISLSIDHSSRCKLNIYILKHTKEKPPQIMILFSKLVRHWKSKEWTKFGLQCLLLIFIYSNQHFKSLVKTRTLNAGTSGLIPTRNRQNILTYIRHFTSLSEKILRVNGHPEHFGMYYFWGNHQMGLKLVHSSKRKKNNRRIYSWQISSV